jgi:hypothetical protein
MSDGGHPPQGLVSPTGDERLCCAAGASQALFSENIWSGLATI